jgi:hypothetical protein
MPLPPRKFNESIYSDEICCLGRGVQVHVRFAAMNPSHRDTLP